MLTSEMLISSGFVILVLTFIQLLIVGTSFYIWKAKEQPKKSREDKLDELLGKALIWPMAASVLMIVLSFFIP